MAKILIDTGVFVALMDKDDNFHTQALAFIKNNRSALVTTLANVTETLYLLDTIDSQTRFLKWLHLGVIEIMSLTHHDMAQIANLMTQYANVPMDFADGCLLHLANQFKINQIATIDSDFHIYRIDGKYPFKWVL